MRARKISKLDDIDGLIADQNRISAMRSGLEQGDIYIIKNVIDPELLENIQRYLAIIGTSSLPNYHPIEPGAPNFHRINRWDPRAYVRGCFHQFSFFPWNDDFFGLFEIAKPVYRLKNLLSGIEQDAFLGNEPEKGCVSRIAFQFYPAGGGELNAHMDPVDYHQLTVPTTLLLPKGGSLDKGGAFVIGEDGERILIDELQSPGDIVYFNASIEHGVARVDPDETMNWLDFKGRWMMLFSVNKVSQNADIGNAIDLSAAEN